MTVDKDLLVIGGGPGGLSASIYGSADGLSTMVVDSKEVLGGQAGQSSLLENVIGFPRGISGREFIKRAVAQSQKFGTEFRYPVVARQIIRDGNDFLVILSDSTEVHAKTVVLAPGLSYAPLQAANLEAFMGKGISYGPHRISNHRKRKLRAYVVGGANSAGQAAMNLSRRGDACEVIMLVRGAGIRDSMSDYLYKRIVAASNIQVWTRTTVVEAQGDRRLRKLVILREGSQEVVEADAMQIFIGAAPKTDWLKGIVSLNERGFIHTGYDLIKDKGLWRFDNRPPFPYETSEAGIWSIGDVRTTSIKRVGAAAGEGSSVIARIHEHFHFLSQS